MDNAVELLCKSIGVSALLYLNYYLLLRNLPFHFFNRAYLLGTIAASVVFPFMPFRTVIISRGAFGVTGSISTAMIIYGLVFMLLLLRLGVGIRKLYLIKRRALIIKIGNITVISTHLDYAPFSFFNDIFWREDISLQSIEGKKIWVHELTHIAQKHSYDKMFVHVIACVGWINPFYWIIKEEISMVHEFLADEKSVDPGDTALLAGMLLLSSGATHYFHPGQSFFQSSVGRRLRMIKATEKRSFSILRKWAVVPIAAVLLFFCSFTVKNNYDFLQKQHVEKLAAEKAAMK